MLCVGWKEGERVREWLEGVREREEGEQGVEEKEKRKRRGGGKGRGGE